MGTQACHSWDLAGVSVIGDEGSFQLDRSHLFWVGPIRLRPLWPLRLLQSRKEQTACPVPRTCSPSFRFPRSILSTHLQVGSVESSGNTELRLPHTHIACQAESPSLTIFGLQCTPQRPPHEGNI